MLRYIYKHQPEAKNKAKLARKHLKLFSIDKTALKIHKRIQSIYEEIKLDSME